MGRKRQGPSPSVPERNRQFARHLNRLLSEASLDPREFATLLGRKQVLIYKYLQGIHLPRLQDLPEIAQALNLKSCRDLIPPEWCSPHVEKRHTV
jgi:predicted transcriptional regulator